MTFVNRTDAGEQLAAALGTMRLIRPVVLGLPRGGVPVAAPVAHALHAPLDVVLVRKVGLPRQPELALAAIGEDGVCARNEDVLSAARIDEELLAGLVARERLLLDQAGRTFRAARPMIAVDGRTVVLVDDGVATGATASAAASVVAARGAGRIVIAAPVASAESVELLREASTDVVFLQVPAAGAFGGVSRYYRDFSPVSDDEVAGLLQIL